MPGIGYKNGGANAKNGITYKQGFLVLGNDLGDVNQPAVFSSIRELPMAGFGLVLTNPGVGGAQSSALGLTLRNTTPATNALTQFSPPLVFRGNIWNAGAVASWPYETRLFISGSGNGAFTIDTSINGAAPVTMMTIALDNGNIFYNANLQAGNAVYSTNGFIVGAITYWQVANDGAVMANSGNSPAGLRIFNFRSGTGNDEFGRLGYTKTPNVLTLSSEIAGVGMTVRPIQISASGGADVFIPTTGNVLIGKSADDGSRFQVAGSMSLAYREIAAASAFTAADYTINVTAGTFAQSLPTAVGIQGRVYVLKNRGAGAVTLTPAGAELIDGAASLVVAAGGKAIVQSTGAGWITIG
jgi:hypothetical protein